MIELTDVEAAQSAWVRGLLRIRSGGSSQDHYDLAVDFVKSQYQVGAGQLLFCPTKASRSQFRGHLHSAVSYFVGQNKDYPEDSGFALTSWTSVRFENFNVVCDGNRALAMGNYFFGQSDGSEMKVEYSFVYIKGADGKVKIQLHHSALPYSPSK